MKNGSAVPQSQQRKQSHSEGVRRWGMRVVKASPGVAPGAGRGLFAAAGIASGEVIDRACSVEIDAAQCAILDDMHPIGDFYFEHPEDRVRGLSVLGLPSLCNHRDDPNADVRFVHEDGLGWVAELYALRDIPEGEEITYRYKCETWFERSDKAR